MSAELIATESQAKDNIDIIYSGLGVLFDNINSYINQTDFEERNRERLYQTVCAHTVHPTHVRNKLAAPDGFGLVGPSSTVVICGRY